MRFGSKTIHLLGFEEYSPLTGSLTNDRRGILAFSNLTKDHFDRAANLMSETNTIQHERRVYQIDYNGAAKLDDLLTIESHVTEVTNASVKMRQSAKRKGTEQILVTAELRLICVSAESLKPVRLPVAIKEKLEM
jgi:acyl-CoA thioesterase FadM